MILPEGLQSLVASATLTTVWVIAYWIADRTGGPR